MTASLAVKLKRVPALRWKPTGDLAVVALSFVLVVAALYTATFIVGSAAFGGLAYFGLYAILGATVFGIGLPLYWMVVVRRRPLADLGLTPHGLGISLVVQLILAVLLYVSTLARTPLPPFEELLPLVGLALAIGFFEAVFWRGWVLLRLEESFGLIPAILVGSALYAVYHIGYGMTAGEMVFLFFVGILFAVTFRLTRSVFILWPLFQPMGQLVTLIQNPLGLPLLAALGFFEVLIVMFVLVWLANRYHIKHPRPNAAAEA